MLDRKGIFFTFMAFLLASTVLALSIAISQTSIKLEQNLVEETAFREVNNSFNNIRLQVIVAKEGYAGSAYSRFMPFHRFEAGENWFELEQQLPAAEVNLQKTYDALNFFKIFAEEEGSHGLQLEIGKVVQNKNWAGASAPDFPKIEYIVLPQCLKFSVGEETETGTVKFEPGTTEDGCQANFDSESIERYDIEVKVEGLAVFLGCYGDFDAGGGACKQEPDDDSGHYVSIEVFLNGNPDSVISANLSNPLGSRIDIDYLTVGGAVDRVNITFTDEYLIGLSPVGPDLEVETFKVRTEFTEPIDEIVLGKGLFEFSVEKPGFGLCRATEESGCTS